MGGGGVGSGAAPTGRAELEPLGALFVGAERGPLPAPSTGADGAAPLPSGGGSVRAAALRSLNVKLLWLHRER